MNIFLVAKQCYNNVLPTMPVDVCNASGSMFNNVQNFAA